MNVSYYPGCSLKSTAKEFDESVRAICQTLDVGLKELHDWTCCGASSAHSQSDVLSLALPARNLEIAAKEGNDLLVPCAACYQRLKVAEKALVAGKPVAGVSGKYNDSVHIRHVVDFLWEDIGEKAIEAKIKTRLEGLNPVCYYGCLITRPPKVTDAKDPENPMGMDRMLKTLGANVKNWSFKTDCCGGSLILSRPDIALGLTRRLYDMAIEAGADCIVTACPMCHSNLDMRQKEISRHAGKEYRLPVFYVTELLGLAFGDKSVAKWLGRHDVDPRPLLKERGLLRS